MKHSIGSTAKAIALIVGLASVVSVPTKMQAQFEVGRKAADAPRLKVDPFWPKALPDRWVFGELGGVCIDAQDHVFVLSRGTLWPKEPPIAIPAPPVIEFDPEGKVVNSWGDRAKMPKQDNCFMGIERNRHLLFRPRRRAAVDETSANAAA